MQELRWQDAAAKTSEEVWSLWQTHPQGLSKEEASRRLVRYGRNQVASHTIGWGRILWRQVQTPFVALLIAAALLSWLLGERTEAYLILFFLALNTGLGFFQEYRSSKAALLLHQLLAARAECVRNGVAQMIPSEELVPGDIVRFRAGDVFPADIRVCEAETVGVDESILTGESGEVEKHAEALACSTSRLYRAANIGFSGTSVLRGTGWGVVVATGEQTAFGEVSRLTRTEDRPSFFETDMRRFGGFLVRMVGVTLALVLVANIALKGRSANIPELLVFSLVLMVSVLPEALPLFITTSLSRGSVHMARRKVVVKRLSAIESLGSIEVLCTDKTGTLTENRLAVTGVAPWEHVRPEECLRWGFLAGGINQWEETGRAADPFDVALWDRLAAADRKVLGASGIIAKLSFDAKRRRSSAIVRADRQETLVVRGAPESIVARCSHLTTVERGQLLRRVDEEGHKGVRSLAVAVRPNFGSAVYAAVDEDQLHFVGLIFFADPIKATARDAVREAARLGVQVKMITGDSAEVAESVARQAGLLAAGQRVVTGDVWDHLSPAERYAIADKHAVFARIAPSQKYEIIEILQKKYEVGFLGDGVNDAPALSLANVALAVQGASGIAREAADVLLLDASLSVIVDGIREGREIFANMNKYLKSMLASNFGNFYSVALVSLIIPYVPMLPIQILLVDILSDMPMLAQAGDRVGEEDLRRPHHYDVRGIVLIASLLGAVSSVFDFILFASFYRFQNEGILQTNWFVMSILTEVALIYSVRSRGWFFKAIAPNAFVAALSALTGTLAVVLPFTSFGQRFFHFVPPTAGMLAWLFFLVAAYFGLTELVKHWYYQMKSGSRWGLLSASKRV